MTPKKAAPTSLPHAAPVMAQRAVATSTSSTSSTGRKPWIKKTPVAIVLEQIGKQEHKVAEMREAISHEERELGKFTDNYEAALRELIDAKLKHLSVPAEEPGESRGKVINLMDALRRSVGEQGKTCSMGFRKPIQCERSDGLNDLFLRFGCNSIFLHPATKFYLYFLHALF